MGVGEANHGLGQLLAEPLQPKWRLCAMLLGFETRHQRVCHLRYPVWQGKDVRKQLASSRQCPSRELVDQPHHFLAYWIPPFLVWVGQLRNRQSGKSPQLSRFSALSKERNRCARSTVVRPLLVYQLAAWHVRNLSSSRPSDWSRVCTDGHQHAKELSN